MTVIDKNSDGFEETSVADRLIELIASMTDTEQEKLLNYLEPKIPKRKHQRHTGYIFIRYIIDNQKYKGIMKDISGGGVFVETNKSFSIGQEVFMEIPFSNITGSVKIKGLIVRLDENGIGIKFDQTKHIIMDQTRQLIMHNIKK